MKGILFILTTTLLMAFISIDGEKPQADFYNTKWMLTKLHTKEGVQEVAVKKPFIKFDEEKKSAGGNGSCNSFGGSVTIKGDSLSIERLFSTKMYCEAVQKTEDSFFSLLQKANRFEIKEKSLLLLNGEDVLLEFEAE